MKMVSQFHHFGNVWLGLAWSRYINFAMSFMLWSVHSLHHLFLLDSESVARQYDYSQY